MENLTCAINDSKIELEAKISLLLTDFIKEVGDCKINIQVNQQWFMEQSGNKISSGIGVDVTVTL